MFRWISITALAGTVAGIALYHVALRSRHISHVDEPRDVHRFGLVERCLHALAILSATTLGVTGFASAILLGSPLRGGLWLAHFLAAPVFAAAVALIALMWAEDGRFEPHDWQWVKHLGGYLWKKDGLPASRFNAGQKAYFAFIGLATVVMILTGVARLYPVFGPPGQQILYEIHRYCALIFVLAVLSHLYLGTLANPGTLWAMISGRVGPHWSKHHHPVWWERIQEGGK